MTLDGRGLEEGTQAAFTVERFQEEVALEFLEHLGGDAATDVDAAEGEHFQREVAGFGAVEAGEGVEGLDADGIFLGQADLRGDGGEVSIANLFGEPHGLGKAGALAEEAVEIAHAHAGEDAFPANVAVFLAEVDEEFIAEAAIGGEAGVAAFAGEGAMGDAVPEETGLAQSGAGGDEAAIANLGEIGLGVEGEKFVAAKGLDAVRIGLKVVEEADALEAEIGLDFCGIDDPREVGDLDDAVLDRAGDAEAGVADVVRFVTEKLANDIDEFTLGLAGVGAASLQDKLAFLVCVNGQVGFGATDIACEKHEKRLGRNAANVERQITSTRKSFIWGDFDGITGGGRN